MKISFCFRRNIVFLHLPNCLVDLAHPPLDSWGNNENSDRLYFLGGFKITADGDYSHEIKRRMLLGRKGMISLDSILKSRDITLPAKVCLVKAMVFQ